MTYEEEVGHPLSRIFNWSLLPGHCYGPDDLCVRIAAIKILDDALETRARTLSITVRYGKVFREHQPDEYALNDKAKDIPSEIGEAIVAYFLRRRNRPFQADFLLRTHIRVNAITPSPRNGISGGVRVSLKSV